MPTLLCLAAGASTRYGRPKQLDGLGPGGATLVDFTIADALGAARVERVVVVVREEHLAAFDNGLRERWKSRAAVELVVQPVRADGGPPRGTVAAVLAAADRLDDRFLVANADDFYGRQAIGAVARAVASQSPDESAGAVAGFPLGTTLSPAGGVHRAALEADAGDLRHIVELRDLVSDDARTVVSASDPAHRLSIDTPVSMNLWGFTPAVPIAFASLYEEFRRAAPPDAELRIADAVASLLSRDAIRIRVVDAAGPWAGLTHPGDRTATAALLRDLTARGEYGDPVWR